MRLIEMRLSERLRQQKARLFTVKEGHEDGFQFFSFEETTPWKVEELAKEVEELERDAELYRQIFRPSVLALLDEERNRGGGAK